MWGGIVGVGFVMRVALSCNLENFELLIVDKKSVFKTLLTSSCAACAVCIQNLYRAVCKKENCVLKTIL